MNLVFALGNEREYDRMARGMRSIYTTPIFVNLVADPLSLGK